MAFGPRQTGKMAVQKITNTHKIFSSEAFLRDQVSFNIMLVICEQEGAEIYSNEEDFALVLSPEKDCIWAWTINDISAAHRDEMWRFIEYISMGLKVHLFVKSVLINRCALDLKPIRNRFAYQCKKLNDVTQSHGSFRIATQQDLYIIAELIQQCDNLEKDAAIEKAARYLERHTPYLWLDNGDIPVAMAVRKQSAAGFARIGGVYVRPDCRSMGYERSLIHQIANDVIKAKNIPMIYVTDSQKNNSSTRYTDMGFIRCGRISEIAL